MNIGIIRIDKMGDMILTLPIIKALKINNSSIKIDVFASAQNLKIVENFQYIDRIINVDESNNSKKKYDLVLNFSPGAGLARLNSAIGFQNRTNGVTSNDYID